jgi:malonyl-CoA/methylmalonyl-CoA synthetase
MPEMTPIDFIPGLRHAGARPVVAFPDGTLTADELLAAAAAVATQLDGGRTALLWATPQLATVVGLLGGLAAGTPIVPLNPKSGPLELEHVVADARPNALLVGADAQELPAQLAAIQQVVVDPSAHGSALPAIVADDRAALIMYTSGTTGPPKGVVLSRAAVAANLDALAEVWEWTDADVLAHALPLFHVHGLVLGVLGSLRVGAQVRHLGGFDVERTCTALRDGATMLFGVPTMYHRLAADAEADRACADALAGARLLVSGSAALPAADHERITRACGQSVVERYGMTETLIATSTRPGRSRAGYVGPPLPGVELRVVDEDGRDVAHDDATIGSVLVRSPSLMTNYLNRPDATAATLRDGWLMTGDVGALAPDGMLRLVGRSSVDLIKSGGYRIGAGEIEAALASHPAVAEAAVVGLPDADLGERIVAWVVPAEGADPTADELVDRVATALTPHKRPREVRFTDALPRNALGKVQKQLLKDL